MPDWVSETLGKHSLFWVCVIVFMLMVGPTGIEKSIDRFFPPQTELEVAHDLEQIDRRSKKIDRVITNQGEIIRRIGELIKSAEKVELMEMRLTDLENWRMFEELLVRDRNP